MNECIFGHQHFFMNEYPNIFVPVVRSQMNVQINLNKKYGMNISIYIYLGSEDFIDITFGA